MNGKIEIDPFVDHTTMPLEDIHKRFDLIARKEEYFVRFILLVIKTVTGFLINRKSRGFLPL